MKAVCPSCGAHGSVDLFLTDADARAAAALLARMPGDIGPLLLSYLRLFAPAKKAMAWSRSLRLLQELAEMIDAGQVQRYGRAWAAPHAAWREALSAMIDRREKLQLPLSNHGYLLEIIVGNQNHVEAVAEEKVEEERRVDSARRGNGAREKLEAMALNGDTSPHGRAVAALASEIARRAREGQQSMTLAEMKKYQADAKGAFEQEGNAA